MLSKRGVGVMDQLLAFVQEHWLVIAAVLIVILIVVKVIKSMIKWLIIVVLAAAVLIYGFNYTPEEIKEAGSRLIEAAELSKDKAISLIMGDSEEATYETKDDGTFVVTTNRFTIEGRADSQEVTFKYLGQSITLELDDRLKEFIDQVKNNEN